MIAHVSQMLHIDQAGESLGELNILNRFDRTEFALS